MAPTASRNTLILLGAILWLSAAPATNAQPVDADGPALLVEGLQAALAASDVAVLRRLLHPALPADQASTVVALVRPGVTRAVVRERDRVPLVDVPIGEGFGIVVDVFLERGREGAVYTYRLDLQRLSGAGPPSVEEPGWGITKFDLLTAVEGLHRLQVSQDKQYRVTDLTIASEDFEMTIPRGSAFVSEIADGTTALIVFGRGVMRFSPRPAAERNQVRLFCGSEVLSADFTAVFIRVNPYDFDSRVSSAALEPEPVDAGLLSRAEALFAEQVTKTFMLDLQDLSRDTWSLVPGMGDFVAEVNTRRYRTLTYARSSTEAEDVSLFSREQQRNIAVYQSERKLATIGPDYNEDDLAEYDVIDYDIRASFSPGREWIEASARLKLRVRSFVLGALTIRLHEALGVSSVSSDVHGRLLPLRVTGQNSFITNLPTVLSRDDVITLRVNYAGRIPPQSPDREVIDTGADQVIIDTPFVQPEVRWVFSNRSYWYPQNTITDFATARLQLSVPSRYRSVATGSPTSESAGGNARNDVNVSEFISGQPVRYLSWAVTRLQDVATAVVALPEPETARPTANGSTELAREGQPTGTAVATWGVRYDTLDLGVLANPRQVTRGRLLIDEAAEILGFYAGLLDDLPYPTFTLALVDSELPGGHSPAYFALLHQPLPTSGVTWRNDPVYFDSFPQFFMAHELAHQYWGQAVGWKNYHNQWISEGFAQYFAALYAEKHSSANTFTDILRRMRGTVIDNEDEGPISLGYRLGHIRGQSRVFRAIVYNKGALVLHMLRRLVGEAQFFAAIKELYWSSRFTKIGTSDVQRVFERVTGRNLERFFERWILSWTVPRIGWSWRVVRPGEATGTGEGTRLQTAESPGEAGWLALRFEQSRAPGGIFDVPVTVKVRYRDGSDENVVIPITDSVVEALVPISRSVRRVEVNEDGAALAQFDRR